MVILNFLKCPCAACNLILAAGKGTAKLQRDGLRGCTDKEIYQTAARRLEETARYVRHIHLKEGPLRMEQGGFAGLGLFSKPSEDTCSQECHCREADN